MSEMYFEDHPTDPDKVIIRKPQRPRLDQGADYERGFIDGMQEQMRRSVDRAVNAMAKREWVDLDIREVDQICEKYKDQPYKVYVEIRNLLKERNA